MFCMATPQFSLTDVMSGVLTFQESEPSFREDDASSSGPAGVSPASVRRQVERILSSRTFARSPRISRFLSFVVDQALTGKEARLKSICWG